MVLQCDGERERELCRDASAWKTFTQVEAQELPADVAYALEVDGCCVVETVLSEELCGRLVEMVDEELGLALSVLEEKKQNDVDEETDPGDSEIFGNVRCREHRWDLKLPLSPLVKEALKSLLDHLGLALEEQVSEDARLVELSSLISDPGAQQQPLHPDTPSTREGSPGLVTVFTALQPISLPMGPTIVCPGSHKDFDRQESLFKHDLQARATDAVIREFGGRSVCCSAGSSLLMDSRLLHCGGANLDAPLGGKRRRLLYCTWLLPGTAPAGSTYSIRSELKGKFCLRDLRRMLSDADQH